MGHRRLGKSLARRKRPHAQNRGNRLADVEAMVIEENVVNHVLSKAKVEDKAVGFDDLMGGNA